MDDGIDHYITQIEEATNTTRDAIARSLEDIVQVVKDHDDRLDRMRNRTFENMHRVVSTYRGESERITDNLIEVLHEIKNEYANQLAPGRNHIH
eukprot:6071353-Karenia_brevis.AAC.1